jgi:glycolate oxidase iron-sulfur subunit
VKDYGHLLGSDAAKRIAALTCDITEILARLGLRATGQVKPYRVAYHDACSLQHGQLVVDQPRQLLKAAGFQVLDVPEKHFCCGSAGTYNLLQPDIADALGQRKAAHVESVDPDIIAAGNLGCMVQIGRYSTTPIVHTVELTDWATGGPMPEALRGRALREPAPRESATADASMVPNETPPDSAAIW